MLEYSLIMATVVVAFAVASDIGIPRSITQRLSETQDAYSVKLPEHFSANEIGQQAQKFNDQISLK
jgi:hypothetical protein